MLVPARLSSPQMTTLPGLLACFLLTTPASTQEIQQPATSDPFVEYLTDLCTAENYSACTALGEVHASGLYGVEGSPQLAAHLFRRACLDGNEAQACVHLATLIQNEQVDALAGESPEELRRLGVDHLVIEMPLIPSVDATPGACVYRQAFADLGRERVIACIWDDGTVVRSENRLEGGPPFVESAVLPEAFLSAIDSLSQQQFLNRPLFADSISIPDADRITVVVDVDAGRLLISMPASQPLTPECREMALAAWSQARTAIEELAYEGPGLPLSDQSSSSSKPPE